MKYFAETSSMGDNREHETAIKVQVENRNQEDTHPLNCKVLFWN